jgi:hypothetical protein
MVRVETLLRAYVPALVRVIDPPLPVRRKSNAALRVA